MGEGKVFIVVRYLYGLKRSGAEFRAFLEERLDNMGFKSSISDPNFYRKEAITSDSDDS